MSFGRQASDIPAARLRLRVGPAGRILDTPACCQAVARCGIRASPVVKDSISSAVAATAESPDRISGGDRLFESGSLKRVLQESRRILESRVRPPEGVLPYRWSASDADPRIMDLNEVLPLIGAWRIADPALARDLLRSAFAAQADDGSLPRACGPSGAVEESTAPWPLFAQSLQGLHFCAPDPAFMDDLRPRMLRYLGWALSYFDPDGEGRPRWTSRREALVPETWDEQLRSADLAALLLAETEALTRLGAPPDELAPLRIHAQRIADELRAFFWDPGDQIYRDRYADGRFVARRTFSAVLPLVWRNLPALAAVEAGRLLERGGTFGSRTSGVPLWEPWPEDEAPPAAPASHQAILLFGLQQAERWRLTRDLRMRLTAVIEASHDRRRALPTSYQGQDPASLQAPSAVAAAVALQVLADPPALRIRTGPSRWLERLDRHRGTLAAVLVLGLLAGLVLATRWWQRRRIPPGPSLEALVGLAHNKYKRGEYAEAERMCREIVEYWGKDTRLPVRYLYGNALFRTGQYAAAFEQYRRAMEDPDLEPLARFNMAQTLVRLGRRPEALSAFLRLAAEQEQEFPELAERARLASDFLQGRLILPENLR